MPVISFTSFDMLPLLQDTGCMDLRLFTPGALRLASSFSVPSSATLAASVLLQSLARPGKSGFVHSMVCTGSPPSPKRLCQMGLILSLFRSATLELSTFIMEHGNFDLTLLSKGFNQVASAIPIMFAGHSGSFPSIQQLLCAGFFMSLGPFLGKLDCITPVIDFLRLGFFTFPRSLAHFGLLPFALDCSALLDLMPSPHGPTCIELSPSVIGHKRLGTLLLPLDIASSDLLILPKGFGCLGSASLVPCVSHLGLLIMVQHLSGLELSPPISGVCRVGLVLLVLTFGFVGAFISMRSFGYLGLPSSTLDTSLLGSSPLAQNSIWSDFGLPLCGECQFFQVSVREFLLLDLPLLPQAFSQSEFFLTVLDNAHAEASLSSHNMLPIEPLLVLFGCCRTGPTLSVSGSASFDLFLLVRGTAHLASGPFLFGFCDFDLFLLMHRFSCSGPSTLPSGLLHSGFVVLASGMGHPGLSVSLQSFLCLAVFIPAWDFSHCDSMLFSHSAARIASAASALGVRLGVILSVFDLLHSDSLTFAQGFSRLDVFLSIAYFSHFDPSLFVRGTN